MVPTSLAAGAQRQASPPTGQAAYGSPYDANASNNNYNPNAGHAQDRSYTLGGGGYDPYGYSDPYAANTTKQSMPVPGVATAITSDMPSPPGRSPNIGGYSPSPPPMTARLVASSPPPMSSSAVPVHASAQMPMPGISSHSQQFASGRLGSPMQYEDSPPVYDAGPGGPSVPVPDWGSKGR